LKLRDTQSGYTITELLVVLVVLGLIAAAITPQVMGRMDSSKIRAARLQLDTTLSALDSFLIDVGRYPTEEEGLRGLLVEPPGAKGWAGPYVRSNRNLVDPWGQSLLFAIDSEGQAQVRTLGADGKEGGEGNDGDLVAPEAINGDPP
jgi:general secretion pathway protein G